MMHNEKIRLSKLMSERGLCSRREADLYIERGQVIVDGEVVSVLGTKVSLDATISLKAGAKEKQHNKVTILLHKPVGYVSTQPEKGYRPAIDLIRPENQYQGRYTRPLQPQHLSYLSVAGRLDIESKGLLILTQDGVVAKTIIGPESDLEKEYHVGVEGQITENVLEELSFGLKLDNQMLKRAAVTILRPSTLRFILKEGKKRQIRRMCELVGLRVTMLKRVRIGKLMLGNLPEGMWRFMESHEKI